MKKKHYLFFISIFIALIIVEIYLKIYKFPMSGAWRVQDNDGMYLNKSSGQSKHQYFRGNEFINVKYKFYKYYNRSYQNFSSKNKDRILILGDSFTFGWLLRDEDTFVYKLQNDFPDKYFINSAAGGWGFDDYARFLDNYCKEIKPKKVLIFISNVSNDLADSVYSNLYNLEKNSLVEGKNDINKFKRFLNRTSLYQFILENISVLQLIRSFYVTYYHYFFELKVDKKFDKNTIKNNYKVESKIEKVSQKEIKDKIYLNLIFSEIIKNTEACDADLSVINLAWDNDKRNKLNDKLNETNKLKFNLFDFYDKNNYLWVNKTKFALEEGHPNSLGNQYFYDKINPIMKIIFR